MQKVIDREADLGRILMNAEEAPKLLHPSMADRYRQEVSRLRKALNAP